MPSDTLDCASRGLASAAPPAPAAARPVFCVLPRGAPAPGSSVFVGPSGVGKTRFLAALGRAFALEGSAEWSRFVAGHELAALMNHAWPGDGTAHAPALAKAASAPTYTFQLGVGSAEDEGESEMEVSVLDTPGAFFEALVAGDGGGLTEEQVKDLVRATRTAHCLVLFADVGREEPLRLTAVVDQLLGIGPRRLRRMGAKPWPARESPWERAPRLELPFKRVLVLLTGIETLCVDVARSLMQAEEEWLTGSPADARERASCRELSAWDVAEMLDVRALAEDRIDGLALLASALKPGAQLAACLVSASGLWRTPLLDQGKRATMFDSPSARSTLHGRTAANPGFIPFGIWPSLLFMTSGRAVPPLITLDPDHQPAEPPQWSWRDEAPAEEP